MASLFFDAQMRCLAYMEWVFEIFCAVRKDYGANYMQYSAELLGILSVHIIARGEHTLLERLYEEQFDCGDFQILAFSCCRYFVRPSLSLQFLF